MSDYNFLALHVLSFLIGALPIGYLVAKAKGIDIRQQGSGNPGATNVARVVGKASGVITLIGDVLKGIVGTCVVLLLLDPRTVTYREFATLAASFGFAAIVGHCFSPFLRFRGGKGVATGLGVFLVLCPLATLLAGLVFLVLVKSLRYVSLGSIGSALSLPLFVWLLGSKGQSPQLLLVAACTASLIIIRHRANIFRLLEGTEGRI